MQIRGDIIVHLVTHKKGVKMSKIKIFALGGLNENGKNMYVVNVDNEIFVFDAGLKYDNDINLGIDLEENRKKKL